MKKILCVCSSATVQDVSRILKKTPDMESDKIKEILQIGSRCGGCSGCGGDDCVLGFSPGVDITLEDALKDLKRRK